MMISWLPQKFAASLKEFIVILYLFSVICMKYFLDTQSRVMTMEGVRPCVGGREMRNEPKYGPCHCFISLLQAGLT